MADQDGVTTVYRAADNTIFESYEEAKAHNRNGPMMARVACVIISYTTSTQAQAEAATGAIFGEFELRLKPPLPRAPPSRISRRPREDEPDGA